MRHQDALARQAFSKTARDGTQIVRHLEDGSMRVMLSPARTKDFRWHRPERHVPAAQWNPATGVTRWEFERQHTPGQQAALLRELGYKFQTSPPQLPSEELWAKVAQVRDSQENLPSGLPGADLGEEVHRELRSLLHDAYSPDGQWRFLVQAVRFGDGVADRLDVRHADYRTVADWTLLCRLRAWVLPDDRDAFLYLPGQDPLREGWRHAYENATPNNLALLSPRWGGAA